LKPDNGILFPAISARSDEGNTAPPALTVEDITRSRLRHHKGFDVIVTNPPFAGEVREAQVLSSYTLSRRGRTERDVLFLERCLELLAPNGRMAIVLPHNKFAMGAFDYVRTWLLKKAKVIAVVGLGRNTFLPHTHQKASILFVQKRADTSRCEADEPIFFAISERDGKNSKGQVITKSDASVEDGPWKRVDHDFQEIIDEFDAFRSRRDAATG
jgi:type I restriction enzyme M protein